MSMQDHVHIALTLGGSPEFAPIHEWKVTDYQEMPKVILSSKRTSNGKLRWHTINTVDGAIKFMDYRMTLSCLTDDTYTGRQYKAFLEAMNGEDVYFVDFDHPMDGSDHTSAIVAMKLQISRVKPMTPALNYYLIDIELEDNHTVP